MMPELRFPDFKDAWRDATAGDAFAHSKAKGETGLPIWSVTLDRGMVSRDSLDRHMESDAADETNLRAQPGDLVYNMMRMWQGAVGQVSEECMVSPAYVVLSPRPGTCSRFFDYWFKAPHMLHRLKSFSHGLTKDRLRLYYADFAKIPIPLPSEDEQRKIADFMDTVSERIALLNREKAALEDYKKGLMQRLFSQELRFTREDGSPFPDWDEKPLNVIAEINPPCRSFPDSFQYIDLESVSGGRLHGAKLRSRSEAPSRAQRVLSQGDVLFQLVRPYQRNNLWFRLEGDFVASTGYAQLRARQDPGFLYQVIQAEKFVDEVISRCTGAVYPAITSKDLGQIRVPVPCKGEQKRIADFLSSIDTKIDAVLDHITHMETFKKGLIQKLFV